MDSYHLFKKTGLVWDINALTDSIYLKQMTLKVNIILEPEILKFLESSPIFLQFLDFTFQLMKQFPTSFEFTSAFLGLFTKL